MSCVQIVSISQFNSHRRVPSNMKLKTIVYNKTRGFAGHTIHIGVPNDATVAELKKSIETSTHIPHQIQWIVFGVRHLEDSSKLTDFGIQEGYTVYSTPTYVEIPELPNL